MRSSLRGVRLRAHLDRWSFPGSADLRGHEGRRVGLNLTDSLGAEDFFTALWAFVELNTWDFVGFPLEGARDRSPDSPNPGATTGWTVFVIHHCIHWARLADTRK